MTLQQEIALILASGSFHGRKVEIVDPDDRRNRQIYEDLDVEVIGEERKALITIHPEHAVEAAKGDTEAGLVVVTMSKAVADLRRMLERFGYEPVRVSRDILE
jgi:hypothetical protein